jgi:pimeloyl-ACP methyl ester carboxylesterase
MQPTAKLRLPVGAILDGEGELSIAAAVYAPSAPERAAGLMFCLPGGGVTKRYFNLGDAGAGWSFAEAMTARGFIVVAFDHLGVGESSKPKDGFALTSAIIAEANGKALELLRGQLAAGEVPGIGPQSALPLIGVGHSMGAMLLVVQEATRRECAALVLLGFGSAGLPSVLNDAEREALKLPDRGLSQYQQLARARFGGDGYGAVPRAESRSPVSLALAEAGGNLLSAPALHSMMPGNVKEALASLEPPIFLAIGDGDLVSDPHALPADYTSCRDITLMVLHKCGHHQFVAAAGPGMMRRIADWALSVVV